MHADDAESLQDLLRRESRSLLQYASESFPWSKPKARAAGDAVCAMAQAQTDVVARLARWLAKQRVTVAFPGAYPMHFTTGNFVALQYLLPRLIVDEQRLVAAAQRTRAGLEPGDAQALVGELIDLKTKHVIDLGHLIGPTTPSALAS